MRHSLRIVLTALTIVIFVGWILQLSAPFRIPILDHNLDEVQLGIDHRLIQVVGELQSTGSNPRLEQVQLILNEAHVYDDGPASHQICIDQLIVWSYISNKWDEPFTLAVANEGFGSKPNPIVCVALQSGFGRSQISFKSALTALTGRTEPIWFYPYDGYLLRYRLEAVYRLLDANDQELDSGRINANYYIQVRIPGWDTTQGGRSDKSYPLQIQTARPLSLQLFVPIIAILIGGLLWATRRVGDLGITVQAGTALALGIWVTRQALLPNSVPGTTALDLVFWCEYVMLGVIVLESVLRGTRSRQSAGRSDNGILYNSQNRRDSMQGGVAARSHSGWKNVLAAGVTLAVLWTVVRARNTRPKRRRP